MPKFFSPSLRGWLAIFFWAGSLVAQENDPLQRARLLIAETNYHAAIPLLKEIVAGDSLSLHAQYYLGVCQLATGNAQEAVESFQRAVNIDSANIPVLTALARGYDQLGLLKEAERAYLAALPYDSSGFSVAPALGRFYAETKQWAKALPVYSRLALRDSFHAGYQIQLAKCYTGIQAVESAIVHYERALQLSPLNAAVALELSALYLNSERLLSASRIIERILPRLREHPQLWRRAGDIAFKQQAYDRAIVGYANSLHFGDSSATIFRNLGICRYYQDNDSLALALFNEAILRDSTDANNWFYRGVVNRRRQRLPESLSDLQKARALMLHGLLSDAHIQTGMTLEQLKNFPDALNYYREALFTDPTKTIVWYHRALLYDQHLQDTDRAEEQYKEYLKLTEGETSKYRTFAEKRLREFREKRHFEKK